jgi:antitoxin (DNA-binding transcriptional repressor) of toxin-antitoxin stability system
MRIVSISVTEASRNFADCVNRARYQSTAFMLHKNGVAVAQIIPVGQPKTDKEPGMDLSEAQNSAAPRPDLRGESRSMRKPSPSDIW